MYVYVAMEVWLAARRVLAAVGGEEEGEFGNEGGAEWVAGALINVAGMCASARHKLQWRMSRHRPSLLSVMLSVCLRCLGLCGWLC